MTRAAALSALVHTRPEPGSLDGHVRAVPARYARSPDARDARIQRVIARAPGDMERLPHHEDKP